MWHFERVLIGPYKGAFTHPCFVRGNKALCASMSRHHLPSPEMYSQAFFAPTHQFLLNHSEHQPSSSSSSSSPSSNHFVTNRTIVEQYNQCASNSNMGVTKSNNEWDNNRIQNTLLTSPIVPIYPTNNEDCENDTKKCPLSSEITTDTTLIAAAHNNIMNSAAKSASKDEELQNDLLSVDSETDWTLLSDCLGRLLNPSSINMGTDDGHKPTTNVVLDGGDRISEKWYYPIDALPPGMEEPASPEVVETLFAELSRY